MLGLLLTFALLPFAFFMLLPRRWIPAFSLAIAAASVLLWTQEKNCVSCGSPGSGLGIALVMFANASVIAALGIRFIHAYFKPAINGTAMGHTPASLAGTYAVAACLAALSLTAIAVDAANTMFDSGLVTHLVVIVLAIAWFWNFSLGRFVSSSLDAGSWLQPAGVIKYTGFLTISCAVCWSLTNVPATLSAAQVASGDEPYCLQTAGPNGFRNPSSKFELSGFVMRAGYHSPRHALLAVGSAQSPRWMYWSYGRQAFVDEFMGGVLRCEPTAQYAQTQGWFRNESTGEAPPDQFWLAGSKWGIPAEFNGSANDKPARLGFYARGANFEPLPGVTRDERRMDVILRRVEISLCTPQKLHPWQIDVGDPDKKVTQEGDEAGLQKLVISSKSGGGAETHLVHRDAVGGLDTWILCGQGQCRHAFKRNGIAFQFMHDSNELASWRKLQDSAWSRLMSFSLTTPVPASPC